MYWFQIRDKIKSHCLLFGHRCSLINIIKVVIDCRTIVVPNFDATVRNVRNMWDIGINTMQSISSSILAFINIAWCSTIFNNIVRVFVFCLYFLWSSIFFSSWGSHYTSWEPRIYNKNPCLYKSGKQKWFNLPWCNKEIIFYYQSIWREPFPDQLPSPWGLPLLDWEIPGDFVSRVGGWWDLWKRRTSAWYNAKESPLGNFCFSRGNICCTEISWNFKRSSATIWRRTIYSLLRKTADEVDEFESKQLFNSTTLFSKA